jgi:hypothetical protein
MYSPVLLNFLEHRLSKAGEAICLPKVLQNAWSTRSAIAIKYLA